MGKQTFLYKDQRQMATNVYAGDFPRGRRPPAPPPPPAVYELYADELALSTDSAFVTHGVGTAVVLLSSWLFFCSAIEAVAVAFPSVRASKLQPDAATDDPKLRARAKSVRREGLTYTPFGGLRAGSLASSLVSALCACAYVCSPSLSINHTKNKIPPLWGLAS